MGNGSHTLVVGSDMVSAQGHFIFVPQVPTCKHKFPQRCFHRTDKDTPPSHARVRPGGQVAVESGDSGRGLLGGSVLPSSDVPPGSDPSGTAQTTYLQT